jgi:DNA-binding NarL/FixJ family response regulator
MNPWSQLLTPTQPVVARRVRNPDPEPRKAPDNPWCLTPCEKRLMDAIVEVGHYKRAAAMLGLSPKTVECYMRDIRRKMGIEHQIVAAVTWDRFIRQAAQ